MRTTPSLAPRRPALNDRRVAICFAPHFACPLQTASAAVRFTVLAVPLPFPNIFQRATAIAPSVKADLFLHWAVRRIEPHDNRPKAMPPSCSSRIGGIAPLASRARKRRSVLASLIRLDLLGRSRDWTFLKCLCTRAFGLASITYFPAKFLFSTAVLSTSFAHDLKDRARLT
jgi:hypothetical protein